MAQAMLSLTIKTSAMNILTLLLFMYCMYKLCIPFIIAIVILLSGYLLLRI